MKIFSDNREIGFVSSIFPGGEVHIRIVDDIYNVDDVSIFALLKSSDDIFKLLLITDALKRRHARKIYLAIPYLPYARQDRVCEIGESLSIKVMCDLINSQSYEKVTIADVHSDVSLALLDNVFHMDVYEFIKNLDIEFKNSILVSPDSGSLKKVSYLANIWNIPFVRADKRRSNDNWEVTVYSDHIGNKNFLIVDDICDGGRTFVELAKKLRPLTNGEVNLYVTHGIFSKGMSVFEGFIDKIYCSHPWILWDDFKRDRFFDVNKRIVK